MNLRVTLHIAAKELRYLVYSPIGWIVLGVFAVQLGSVFVGLIGQIYEGLAYGRTPRSVAGEIYTRSGIGMIARTVDIIYLYVPLLTMATFSRELHSGSIKLLMSSPLRPIEIAIGKYLAVATFLLLFIGIIGLTVPISALITPNLDYPAAIPGMVGLFLLACTYASIGVFISSLTKHQIIAAIITLAILFVLGSIDWWFRGVRVLNEITHWASLAGRVSDFQDGMLATHHVVYFIAIICLFLTFTTLRVASLRLGGRLGNVIANGGVASTIVVSVGWVLSLPQFTAHFDTTYDRRNSLSPESVAIMSKLEGPWEIETYANIFAPFGRLGLSREHIDDRLRYRAYMQHNHQLSMRYNLYYSLAVNEDLAELNAGRPEVEVALEYARRFQFDLDKLQTTEELSSANGVDLVAEQERTFRVFRWNDKQAVVRFFDDAIRYPQERTRAAALRRLVEGPTNIAMLVSNAERQATRAWPTDYRREFSHITNRWALINHGFDLNEVSPDNWASDETDILVIADPRQPYSQAAINKIFSYLNRGGDLVLLVEQESVESVDLLLNNLGLARGSQLSPTHEEGYPESLVLGRVTQGPLTIYSGARDRLPVALDGAVELYQTSEDDEFERVPVVLASQAQRVDLDPDQEIGAQPIIVGFALERDVGNEQQRILVFGDADLYSTARNERREPLTGNARVDAFHYLSDGKYPVQRTRRETIDVTLNIERNEIDLMRWFLVGGLPLAILSMGGLLLVARRRR